VRPDGNEYAREARWMLQRAASWRTEIAEKYFPFALCHIVEKKEEGKWCKERLLYFL